MSEGAKAATPRLRFRLGAMVAVLCLALDQLSKYILIYHTDLRITYPWPILPIFDLTVVWNYGISYGLFQQHTQWGRWGLVALKLGAAVVLSFWLRKAEGRLEAVGIGLIIGGAIGNAIDRIVHGAVFDFAYFHLGSFEWYVFNVADAGIVLGVAMLLLAQFVPDASAPEKS